MSSIPSETEPTSISDGPYHSPPDSHILTNRTSSSPRFTPDSALEPPAAECTSDDRTVTTSDKRARPLEMRSNSLRKLQGSHQRSRIRKPCDSSVKESEGGIAQSFLESVNAAVATPQDATTYDTAIPTESTTCECCCRCGRSPKWQPAASGRKRRSKSHLGVSEISGWDLEPPRPQEPAEIELQRSFGLGQAPIERLPAEVLDEIISQLAVDGPPANYGPRNGDLVSCLLTSKTLHHATINIVYSQATIPNSGAFAKFLRQLSEKPGRGTLVRRLDLSQLSSVGFRRSQQENEEIQNLTSKTLFNCLELTPAIQEVLLQENLDDDIDENVLQKLFLGLPNLQAVDFCASASQSFVNAFNSTLANFLYSPSPMLKIRRLGLHECLTLPSSAFENLLPRLSRLTHLDVSHTRITDKALLSIPTSATLSHLNLRRCTQVTGEGVVDFLSTHPAARGLVYLNLACDISQYRLLWEPDVDRLLPSLPSTLRSLNLNGAHIHPRHLPHLLPLTKHLEELGLACATLSLADVNSFFRPPPIDDNATPPDNQHQWQPPTLHYLDLTAIASITQATLFHTPAPANVLLTTAALPLEVIELGDRVISCLRECKNTNKRLGWVIKELGRRAWYVRDTGAVTNGRRAWKMGAVWWGMRKVPVAWGEVAGSYGHYMFKK